MFVITKKVNVSIDHSALSTDNTHVEPMVHRWRKRRLRQEFFSGNIEILLAKQGYKTLLIDADLGAANLHTIIGIPYPERCLSDFINKRVSTLDETVGPHPSRGFICIGDISATIFLNTISEKPWRVIFTTG